MGNDCKACNKRNAEHELIIGVRPLDGRNPKDKYEIFDKSRNEPKFMTFKEIINKNPEQYKKLLKLKNAILIHRAKKNYKYLLAKNREEQKIFTHEELFETLSKKKLKELKVFRNKLYTYKTGAVYQGDWLGGFRHGQGTMKWPDGITYSGSWVYGFAEGQGTLTYSQGEYLTGIFMHNKLNGYGEIHNEENGYEYWGNWENDQQMGEGREKWRDKSTYEGNYEYGKKNGKGKYTWEDGTYYFGEWKNNKIHGLGIYEWPDGRKYLGEWRNAKMSGFGISIWSNGKYVGEYAEDKKSGFGVYVDNNKNKYEGFWYKGQHNGLGKLTKNDGSCRVGLWENNKMKIVINDVKDIEMKLREIQNNIIENNQKAILTIQKIHNLLGIRFNINEFQVDSYKNYS